MRLTRYYSYPASRSRSAEEGFRSPWSGLESEIDRLFQSTLAGFGDSSSNQFPLDLYEDKNNVYLRAELPGVSRDDIHVEIVNGYLTISAARKTASSEGKGEESFALSRSIRVSEQAQTDNISATYENGILTVTVPKREEAKPKKVTVSIK